MADINKELECLEEVETPPESSLLPRNDDDILEEELIGKMRSLHVDPPQGRFFGKSSGYQLVQTALDIRGEYIGKEKNRAISAFKGQRSEYWSTPPWHPSIYERAKPPKYTFPDDDLITSLVDAYFTQINPFYPLLHRPSFEKLLANGLHQRDTYFGGTVLLVCALGSRYSNDPRTLYPGRTSLHSAGWRWFEQVEVIRKSFVAPPSLGELQNHALHVLFSQASEAPHGCWTQLGMALRMAQEVGAHRRRTLKAPTAEDEQWKRVFWVLMSLDRLVSSFSGRPCVFSEEDYDVDRPIECDDEYWDHPDPSLAFQQPPNKPSTITYFNHYLRLMDILSHAMKVIYSVKKSTQSAPYLDQKIIMDLDSAMNGWMDSVPEHREGTMFTAAVVLLLNIWSGKRDILMDLATAGDLSFSEGPSGTVDSSTGQKRPRDCDTIADAQADAWFNNVLKNQREAAGSRRVSIDQSSPPIPQSQTLNYDLPMYATELGRLPVYGQFKFSESYKRPRHDSSSGGTSSFISPLPQGEATFASYPIGDMGSMPNLQPTFASYPIGDMGSMPSLQPTLPQYNVPSEGWGQFSAPQGLKASMYHDHSIGHLPIVDNGDLLTMWSTAPTRFEYVPPV
ncbi:hypothetical protein DXG03_002231 [Asterophora parasitica]|uniref:Xylanolytic transcriptional activator regulatory domain-containing protein n=1 Tax=Asterophora parasitica TaxID=117018 RepID=A0A9P7KBB8_9AGAR|nr:hypothetical protein DXG03_002231 [Asterophora parasitica]